MSSSMTSPYSIVYSFGDSLADAGNAYLLTTSPALNDQVAGVSLGSLEGVTTEPVSPPYAAITYAGGLTADVFSNGPTSVQNISNDLGDGITAPSGVGTTLSTLTSVATALTGSALAGGAVIAALEAAGAITVSGTFVSLAKGVPGGTDFAIGGAVTGPTGEQGGASNLTDLASQLATFQHDVPSPSPTALYTVTIGSNDMLALLQSPGTQTATQLQNDLTLSVANELTFIGSLVADGAKNILVQNVPDLGRTPAVEAGGTAAMGEGTDLALEYDNVLQAGLQTITGATITVENLFNLIDQAVADPVLYGLTNVDTPVYSGTIGADNGPVVSTNPAVQNTYLFFDMLHPTEGGQTASANAGLTALGLAAFACFAEHTRIETTQGLVPIEALRVGDTVPTVFGGTRPVIWIGRRRVDCRRHPKPRDVWPVRVRAHAFGRGKPARDLLLSPDHAIYAADVLIPIKYLIDGDAVTQVELDQITYWHLELPQHDVILADGLAAESFLDTGQRHAFEGEMAMMIHPDFSARIWEARGCAPLMVCGPEVDRVKARLQTARSRRTARRRAA